MFRMKPIRPMEWLRIGLNPVTVLMVVEIAAASRLKLAGEGACSRDIDLL